MLYHVDLFSGIAGWSLGLEAIGRCTGKFKEPKFQTVAFCEAAEFPRKVLRHWYPNVAIFDDIHTLNHEKWSEYDLPKPEEIFICTSSFPCQPFSTAGKRKGSSDHRDLREPMLRTLSFLQPPVIMLENVVGLASQEQGKVFEKLCTDLEAQDYEIQTFDIPASAIENGRHHRHRLWIVCIRNSHHNGSFATAVPRSTIQTSNPSQKGTEATWKSQRTSGQRNFSFMDENQPNILSNPTRIRQPGSGTLGEPSDSEKNQVREATDTQYDREKIKEEWKSLSTVGGTSHGIPPKFRQNQLKALGNSVVPEIVTILGECLLEAMETTF